MTWLTRIEEWFKGTFTNAEKDIVVAFEAGIKSVEQNGGKVLTDAAAAAVKAAEANGGTGKEKAFAAAAAVMAVLMAEGIPVLLNAVNIAIEMAVAEMNKDRNVSNVSIAATVA